MWFQRFTEWASAHFGGFFGKMNRKTTPAGVIEKEFQAYPAASRQMEDNINLWWNMYINTPPWETCDIRPLGLPGAIGRELARQVFTEFTVAVSGGVRADYLNEQIETAKTDFSKHLEMGLCLGGIAFKPYIQGDRILIDACSTGFTSTRFDGAGRAIGGVFKSNPTRSGDMWFIRMEYHDFQTTENGTIYTVKNKVFRSDQNGGIGSEVPLNSVPEWADIQPEQSIAGLERPLFAYFKPPIANNVEPESPLGISVYSGTTAELIQQADEQWRLIRWEYESGKRRVYLDGVDNGQFNDEIFVVGPFASDGNFFEVFSPEFRDNPLYDGFQRILQRIEFNAGLSYGTLSDPQSVEKTATEILSAKQRQYTTVKDIQKAFTATLEDILYAMDALCSLYALAPSGEYKLECQWGDGVLDDPDQQRQDKALDVQLINNGVLSPVEFRMKWFGEDEETAKRMIVQIKSDSEEVEPVMEEVE